MPSSSRYAHPLATARKAAPQRRRLFLEPLESRQLLAAFTPGTVVAYRVGTGAAALSSNATEVFLDEFTPTGTFVQTIALPTSAAGNQRALTATGANAGISEGLLTRSVDGQYLLLTGYDATPGTASPAGALPNVVNRVVARLNDQGNIDKND